MAPTTDELDKRLKKLEEKRIPLIVQFLVPTGTVIPFAGSTAPTGWVLCDGSAIGRVEYAALFEVIKETYGAGDSSTTFNLPDLRGRTAIGAGQGSGLSDRPMGQAIGAEFHTMSLTEMPQHSHLGAIDIAGIHSHGDFVAGAGGHDHGGITQGDASHAHDGGIAAAAAHNHSGSVSGGNPVKVLASNRSVTIPDGDGGGGSGGGIGRGTSLDPVDVLSTSGNRTFTTSSSGNHSHTFSVGQGGHQHALAATGDHQHSIPSDPGHQHGISISETGSNEPHNNMQPFVVLSYIIKI